MMSLMSKLLQNVLLTFHSMCVCVNVVLYSFCKKGGEEEIVSWPPTVSLSHVHPTSQLSDEVSVVLCLCFM